MDYDFFKFLLPLPFLFLFLFLFLLNTDIYYLYIYINIVVYKEHHDSSEDLTFMDVFLQARAVIKSKGFKQIPQLSSSRRIDVNQPFNIMSNRYGNKGTRYAVLIGINYTSHKQGQLSGCHNDVQNIHRYIMDVGKVRESNITILMDDGRSTHPTKANIMKALEELCRKCKPGDTAFVHYSGEYCTVLYYTDVLC